MKQFIDRFFPYQMVKLILKKSTSSLESSTPRISSFIDNTEKGALKEQLLGYLNYFAANDETSLLHQEKYAEILQKVKNNALHPPRLLVKPSTIPLAGTY